MRSETELYLAMLDYVRSGGFRCPLCDSDKIDEEDAPDLQDNFYLYQFAGCNNCGGSWTKRYTLSDIIDVKIGDK